MIKSGTIKNLVNEEKDIFGQAQELSFKKPLLLHSPLVITRACNSKPLCKYCNWRAYRGVMKNATARIAKEEVISRVKHIEEAGIKHITILSGCMGELPKYFYDYIEEIRKNTGLKITVVFGAVNRTDLKSLRTAGVDCICSGLETTNEAVFKALKPGDSYNARLKTLQEAKELGFRTETGFIIGLGESIDDIDTGIRLAEQLGVGLLTVYSFTPTPFTETQDWERPRSYHVAKITAAARICMPELDIAASFGCDNASVNYAWGIMSGANAFSVSLRGPKDTPVLTGDEISNISLMWHDSQLINKH